MAMRGPPDTLAASAVAPGALTAVAFVVGAVASGADINVYCFCADGGQSAAMTSLAELESRISACTLCAERFAQTATAHQPRPVVRISPTARVLIAGQAPGARVHASGLPFDDPSGERLRDWMGIDRETFYDTRHVAIVPMGFCFPGYDAKGSDLPPPKLCAQTWRNEVLAHLPRISLTLLVGQYAQAWHMKSAKKRSLTETVQAWREYGPDCLPLPHPSWRNTGWIKKNPWFSEDVLPWLKAEVSRLVG